LLEMFGEEYIHYKSKVPALLTLKKPKI
jgi:protein-S-isoprenylcysteine O-methyltransferase Ste14